MSKIKLKTLKTPECENSIGNEWSEKALTTYDRKSVFELK